MTGRLFETFPFASGLPLDTDLEDEKTTEITVAELLGDVIWEDLSECLIKHCLVYSIPTNSSKLQQYEEVSADTRVPFGVSRVSWETVCSLEISLNK